ncbi:MAG: Ppx/GppA phosphatase family protein [Flavobacteriia bacterium]|jgi:exopolyphosphatase/guanosine-5'-triphosphate,3'-diphosphate pyrophosphatase
MRLGAIDIGSNAVRLHVYDIARNDSKIMLDCLFSHRFPIRLGQDVFNTGNISEEKTSNLRAAIETLHFMAAEWQVETLRSVATSAFRDAENGRDAALHIEETTNVKIDIITGEEEAGLIRAGILTLAKTQTDSCIMIDVGGGSTEVSTFLNGENGPSYSFNVGTVRILAQGFTNTIREEMAEWMENNIPKDLNYTVFATGGNIRRIHKILGHSEVDPLQIPELQDLRSEMVNMTIEERMSRFDLNSDRADVLVPAVDLFLELVKGIPCEELYVPEITLSDGVACDLFLR